MPVPQFPFQGYLGFNWVRTNPHGCIRLPGIWGSEASPYRMCPTTGNSSPPWKMCISIYSNDYFVVVHPAFYFLDQEDFIRRASLRWKSIPTEATSNFDAVICGVVVMGYFVSQKIDNGIEAALTSIAKERFESVRTSEACHRRPHRRVDLASNLSLSDVTPSYLMDGQQYHDASDRSIRHST